MSGCPVVPTQMLILDSHKKSSAHIHWFYQCLPYYIFTETGKENVRGCRTGYKTGEYVPHGYVFSITLTGWTYCYEICNFVTTYYPGLQLVAVSIATTFAKGFVHGRIVSGIHILLTLFQVTGWMLGWMDYLCTRISSIIENLRAPSKSTEALVWRTYCTLVLSTNFSPTYAMDSLSLRGHCCFHIWRDKVRFLGITSLFKVNV